MLEYVVSFTVCLLFLRLYENYASNDAMLNLGSEAHYGLERDYLGSDCPFQLCLVGLLRSLRYFLRSLVMSHRISCTVIFSCTSLLPCILNLQPDFKFGWSP